MPIRTVTIPAGETLSNSVGLGTDKVVAIIMPAGWSANARLSFQLSSDNVTFYDVSAWNTTEVMTVPCVPKQWATLRTDDFPPNTFLKIRSGHPFVPIEQEEERVFQLVVL